MSYKTIHIENICRTCLSEDNNMRSIFSIDESVGETMRLFEMLMSCASVQVLENDGLPSQVCLQCVHYITRAFSFKQLCERSENTLRELLGRPTQTTFLELKPLLAEDVLVPNTVNEIISTVTETLPTVTATLTDVISTEENILTSVADELDSELDIKHSQNDLDMKFEIFDNDASVIQNDTDTDTGQEINSEEIDVKPKPESKEPKKKVIQDETEQPIYPCEKCTRCFTTQSDLKVIMAPMKQITLTKEKILENKRKAERERYKRLKSDPQKREEMQEKERQKYRKKKEKGKRKLVGDMTPREHRAIKKKWKEHCVAYRMKKKNLKSMTNKVEREEGHSLTGQSSSSSQSIVKSSIVLLRSRDI